MNGPFSCRLCKKTLFTPYRALTDFSPSWAPGVTISLQREIIYEIFKKVIKCLCERYWQENRIPMTSSMGCVRVPRIKDIAIRKMC